MTSEPTSEHGVPGLGRPQALVPGLPDPGRCLVMGVVNVTPDSFSDGGLWLDAEAAIAHGVELAEQGADLVDIGGESTRPGAQRPDPDEELRRVVPVVEGLVARGVPVSIDTMRADVARRAVAAGAALVNDVSAGLADDYMVEAVGETGVPWVLMHWRGHSETMAELAVYDDVVREVLSELNTRVEAIVAAGVPTEQLILDPGLGFAKTGEHNWALLAAMDEFVQPGFPVLLGASRKRFLGQLLADAATGDPRPASARDHATAAVTAQAALAGVWGVRVHDVPANVDAALVARRWGDALGARRNQQENGR